MWGCRTCGFVLVKSVLALNAGEVLADQEIHKESCPNDGDVMFPYTYKQLAKENGDVAEKVILRRAELERDVEELRAWKASALEVMNRIDFQAVGRELDVPLGADVAARILPGIKRLKAVCADAANDPVIERLEEGNYTLITALKILLRRNGDRLEYSQAELFDAAEDGRGIYFGPEGITLEEIPE